MSNSWSQILSSPAMLAGIVGLAILVCVGIALAIVWGNRQRPVESYDDLSVDVKELGAHGPPDGVQLEYYGTPVRVALLVLAPAGRHHELPPRDELPSLSEQFIPGFNDILSRHRPSYRSWPPQVSSSGFAHSFFNHVPLPGDRGKSTPWCSLAGKINALGQQYLVGLVLVANNVNGLSQRIVEHEGQWHDILRVRKSA